MAATVNLAQARDPAEYHTPVLVFYNDADTVVGNGSILARILHQ